MKSLQSVEQRGEYYLDLQDGAASLRLAKCSTALAMSTFWELAKVGIKNSGG